MSSISSELSSRISTLSFVCACMVVLIHVPIPSTVGSWGWYLSSTFSYGMCLISVPFFFMVSGFFIGRHIGEEKWYRSALKKRLVSLLIPYLIFNTMYWGLTHLCVNQWTLHSVLCGIIGSPLEFPSLGPTWYIRSLLVYVLITPLLPISYRWWCVTYFIAIVFLCFSDLYPEQNVVRFLKHTCSLQNLFYYHMGLVMGKKGFCGLTRRVGIVAGTFSLLILILKVYADSRGYFIPTVWRLLFCPVTLIAFWKLFPKVKINDYIAKFSFPIFMTHYFMILFLQRLGIDNNSVFGFVFDYAFMLCGSVLLCVLIRTMFPRKVANIIFGGR